MMLRIILKISGNRNVGRINNRRLFSGIRQWRLLAMLLQMLCNKDPEFDCEVMNGGVGGSSSRELRKLMRDVATVGRSPDFIISLNGINELDGYDGAQNSPIHIIMKPNWQHWNLKNSLSQIDLFNFPNTKLMIRKVLALIEGKKGSSQ